MATAKNGNNKGALAFATLFVIESFCRSLNATVLSVQAYDILGSAARVSIVSVAVSLTVLATTLMLPVLLGFMRRRWAYTAGILGAMISAIALASYSLEGQLLGTYFRNASASLLNVTLSLYIMDHVRRQDLVKTESLRLTLSTLSWMIGPALGVFLYDRYGPWGPQLLVFATALLLLVTFWYLKLTDPNVLPPGTMSNKSPLRHIHYFITQPRLRLAWAIAFARSCFWATLFIYGPIVFLQAGATKQFSGLVISLSQAMLLSAIGYGRVAEKIGVRAVITICLVGVGIFAIIASLAGPHNPYVTAAMLLCAAFLCVGLDAVGGIPFLRAVKSRDRQTLTPVYRSFIELSELLPGIVFAFALTFFPTAVVFGIVGAFFFVIAGISWHFLPKSL